MLNPYENCPVFENENFCLRLIDTADAQDLFLVYSDEKAVPYFNSDNCNGDTFHYTLLEHMQGAIAAWQQEYSNHGFVRWTILDKKAQRAVGTIELFAAKLTIILTTAQFCGWTCEATMSRRPRSMKFYLSSCHRPVNCLPVR